MLKGLKNLFWVVCACALVACGGGGGGDADTPSGNVTVSLSYAGASTGTVGTPYRYSPNYYSSQSISEHFALSSGNLPPGLGLSAGDGVISGVPTAAGTYYFTITLTAKNVSGSVSASGSITISSDLILSLTYNPPAGFIGQAYAYTPIFSSNKSVTTLYSASNLPPGLSINTSTGAITGTPTNQGTYYPSIFLSAGGTYLSRYTVITVISASSSSSSAASSSPSIGSSSSSASSISASSASSVAASSSSSAIPSSSSSSVSSAPPTSGAAACTASGSQGTSTMGSGSTLNVALTFANMVYDKGRGVYYATIPSSVVGQGNRIATISASTGAVSYSAIIGSNPNAIAISADCSTLYVGLDGSSELARVALPSMTVDARAALGAPSAESISVSPASPEIVAVSRADFSYSPHNAGTVLFRNMVRQPVSTGSNINNRIGFDTTGNWLYGLDNETSSFGLQKLAVLSNGLQETSSVFTNGGYGRQLDVRDGIIMAGAKAYSDPGLSLLGTLAGSSVCRKLPGIAKVACLFDSYADSKSYLTIAETASFSILNQPSLGSLSAYSRFVPGPSGQIALISSSGITLYQSDLLK